MNDTERTYEGALWIVALCATYSIWRRYHSLKCEYEGVQIFRESEVRRVEQRV